MKKLIIVCVLFCTCSATNADKLDVYPNPYLTDSSLATTFIKKLRNSKINEMEILINGECSQFENYVYLSIQNWTELKKNRKSKDDANSYSEQLISQLPYQQASLYTFPMGTQTYVVAESYIEVNILNDKIGKYDLIKQMKNFCMNVNTNKYFSLLTSDKYSIANQPIFISAAELNQKFYPQQSIFNVLKYVPNVDDKLTPKNMEENVKFTRKDYEVSSLLIDEDIRNSFIDSDVRWIDYKKASREMQIEFHNFMKNGGRNRVFVDIASLVKYMSFEVKNYDFIFREELASTVNSLGFSKENPISNDHKFKEILKKFNY
ncbi:hypothetical protein [Acinetobacter sp. NIPH 298]|uniref:hypothetical protein n=1 Tax=Acinetobacter sp. NIPH 298 TaxID=1217692 RepID=UPI0002CD8732|nr:hypothetical protein [Acinetobacter sp. NIPH 298]ENW96106.1 hypothetical protein F903_01875 [Acinetobacter sp. NIPH 298]